MKYSSLKYSDFSWTEITVYDSSGVAVTTSSSVNLIRITNLSGENRVYSINAGAPFPVPTGTSAVYDLKANDIGKSISKVEYSVATLTSHYVDGA